MWLLASERVGQAEVRFNTAVKFMSESFEIRVCVF